jgi:hypothetical protein
VDLATIADRLAVSDTIIAYATGVDTRNWDLYASIFTDPVMIDFSSWSKRPAGPMAVDAWVAAVRSGLSGFDATQHLSSNHVITFPTAGTARCVSQMQARHVIDARCITLGGHYTNDLVRTDAGWKISTCRLTVTFRLGDLGLFDEARARYRG